MATAIITNNVWSNSAISSTPWFTVPSGGTLNSSSGGSSVSIFSKFDIASSSRPRLSSESALPNSASMSAESISRTLS